MSKRLSIIALFAAWLCASGAMLDVVQVFAWARMFTGYVHTMPLAEAASETLDADKPCPICQAVRRAREDSTNQQPVNAASSVEKLLLAFETTEPVMLAREMESWPESREHTPLSWRAPVPVPPPRINATDSAV